MAVDRGRPCRPCRRRGRVGRGCRGRPHRRRAPSRWLAPLRPRRRRPRPRRRDAARAPPARRAGPERGHLHRPLRRQLAGGRPGQPPLQAPRARRRARHRLDRAADGVPQQRPARRHARLRGTEAPAALGRPPRPPRRRGHRQRAGLRRRPRPAGRRCNRRRGARSPTEPCGRRPPRGAQLARSSRLDRGRGLPGRAGPRLEARADRPDHRPGPDRGRARGDRLRPPRHLGRLHAPGTARLPCRRPPRPRSRAGELPSREPPPGPASRRLGQPGVRAGARDRGRPCGRPGGARRASRRRLARADIVSHAWPIFPHPKGKDFVDLDEDETVQDLLNAVADGFDSPELAKRYTTAGMGPSQGRHAALQRAAHRPVRQRRQPRGCHHDPAPALPARELRPARRPRVRALPADADAPPSPRARCGDDGGGPLVPPRLLRLARRHCGGGPRRPHGCGPDRREHPWRPGDARPRRRRASGPHLHRRLREAAGRPHPLCPGLRPDRGRDRRRRRLPPCSRAFLRHRHHLGRRHALPLDAALAGRVAARCRHRQRHRGLCRREPCRPPLARGPGQPRHATSTSAPDAFPYLAVRTGHLAGIPVRLLRVGFVGELGYEIHCPASYGEALWDLLLASRCPPLRRRGPARAPPGEGPRHRRPGHGRPHLPARGRPGVGDRQGQAVLHRPARHRGPGRPAARPAASSASPSRPTARSRPNACS